MRTPTDIIGQHIHLVKFDVTSSDGSGNGFNYEDGTFSPDEVRERISAIRKQNGCVGVESGDPRDGTFTCPKAKQHPFFGTKGLGAQTTVQRWFADDTLNNNGVDRTLRTVFTHDHFGPSTHQQAGLYAGLVIEPKGSVWKNPETGVTMGTRAVDGGPTSWQANIIETNAANSHREFLFEFADFHLAYQAGAGIGPNGKPIADPVRVINPPIIDEVGLPFIVENGMVCPGGFPAPCPEAISAADQGTMSVNYRNEPVPFRVRNPGTNTQASGAAGDLSKVYKSNITRADPHFNVQPTFYPALTKGVQPGDPFTPLLRAYENDKVQIRILVGAHEETHNMTINGHKWLHQPGTPQDPLAVNNSGFRNSQMAGISEHFEFHYRQRIDHGQPALHRLPVPEQRLSRRTVERRLGNTQSLQRAGRITDRPADLAQQHGGRSALVHQRCVVPDGRYLSRQGSQTTRTLLMLRSRRIPQPRQTPSSCHRI